VNASRRAEFVWDPEVRLDGSSVISSVDAQRQELTAREIVRRLNHQPGLILADEVGLGKTFVALAVAASVATSTTRRRPVVVMVPPALMSKWPQEWRTFAQYCLPPGTKLRATQTTVNRPAPFLKLFDDDAAHRAHIIFLAHGALTRQLQDPYTRLAIIQAAFRRSRNLADARRRFPRWAGKLLQRHLSPAITDDLLSTPVTQWRSILQNSKPNEELADDPVYLGLPQMIRDSGVDLRPLREALAGLPAKQTSTIEERLRVSRANIKAEVQAVWDSIVAFAPFTSPLLILDEAHHVRHDGRISGLFQSAEAEDDAAALQGGGPLAGKFDHMLFLTATPFQLGHRELIRVLSRFDGVRWPNQEERRVYTTTLRQLEGTLDSFQVSAQRVQKLWSRVTTADLDPLPADWWTADYVPQAAGNNAGLQTLHRALRDLIERVDETEQALSPWVIRHVRDNRVDRRRTTAGDGIKSDGSGVEGLAIPPDMLLPFMLAARARTIALDRRLTNSQARPFFAEGIASSFEAYRDTRRNRDNFRDGVETTLVTPDEQLAWYLDWIERSLPQHDPAIANGHPKIRATVERTIDAWRNDDKVLIFCFYKETGRTLRREISAAMERNLITSAAQSLSMDPLDKVAIATRIERTADNVLSIDSSVRRSIETDMTALASSAGFSDLAAHDFVGAVLRFLRTQSFIVRYVFPHGTGIEALAQGLDTPDAYGRTLRNRLGAFVERLAELSEGQRESSLVALNQIQTGQYRTVDRAEGQIEGLMVLPNVRLANGDVRMETRNMLVAAFNMPFFPEVLISSSVLSEGVDLHWECRTVIHHDLDWNPSTLEQRTGRLDRIGSLSEKVSEPIDIYEPYTSGLQDEKTFKVVKDRARWFSIVMGDDGDIDEELADHIADRVPMPPELIERLTLNLSLSFKSRGISPIS